MKVEELEDVYELSPMQQGMLFHTLAEAGTDTYLEQAVFTVGRALDTATFRRAWQAVVNTLADILHASDLSQEEIDAAVQQMVNAGPADPGEEPVEPTEPPRTIDPPLSRWDIKLSWSEYAQGKWSARRTATSRRLRTPLASSRFATFAHAISSTIRLTPPSQRATLASGAGSGPSAAISGSRATRTSAGYPFAICSARAARCSAVASAAAASTPTPSARRATARIQYHPRLSRHSVPASSPWPVSSGIQTSTGSLEVAQGWKSRGMTPITSRVSWR